MHAMWEKDKPWTYPHHGVMLITVMYSGRDVLITYCRDLHARCARDVPGCLICKSDGLRLAWLG
jgi:hypothetical protein